jgi:hypothetical protein
MKKILLVCCFFTLILQKNHASHSVEILQRSVLAVITLPFPGNDTVRVIKNKTVINPGGQISNQYSMVVKSKKMGFFTRVAYKMTPKKLRKQLFTNGAELSPADKKAKTSLILGISALALALIPWYTIIAAIPLGITAIVMGAHAKKMGSEKMNGKGFGFGALAVVVAWIIIGTIALIAWI